MKSLYILSLITFTLHTHVALAEGAAQLDTLILSGSHIPIDGESYARSNTIITGEDLEQNQHKTVADALRTVPGLHVSRTGGAGGTTAVRIRGSESNHVLVLIDGVEAPDSSSEYAFETLTADQIERIEVLRGPQSALYGAGATAGVINIITKGGVDEGHKMSTSFEWGRSDSSNAPSSAMSGILQTGNENGNFSIGVNYRNEEGWDTSDTGGDNDGFEIKTVNFKSQRHISDDIDLNIIARYTDRITEFDNVVSYPTTCSSPDCYVIDAPNTKEGHELYMKVSADMALANGTTTFSPDISYSEQINNYPSFSSSNQSSTLKFIPRLSLQLPSQNILHNLVFTAEAKKEKYRSSSASNNALQERTSYGIAGDYHADITDKMFTQAGIRYDNNDSFQNAFSWAASASYKMGHNTTLHTSIGEGQTNPTFYEQFGNLANTFTGNPDLIPEENISWDVGITQYFPASDVNISIVYFNEWLRNMIQINSDSSYNPTDVENLPGITKKQGVELSATVNPVESVIVNFSYTYLDGKDPSGQSLVRRPRHSGSIDVDYTFPGERAVAGATLTYYGKHYQLDYAANAPIEPSLRPPTPRDVKDSYTTLDLNGSYKLSDKIELFGSVKNALNKDYEEVLGYKGQPATVYMGVNFVW